MLSIMPDCFVISTEFSPLFLRHFCIQTWSGLSIVSRGYEKNYFDFFFLIFKMNLGKV